MTDSNHNFSPELLPRHVAIIPDGNRRFARERDQEPWEGHEAGAEITEKIIREARNMGIREMSFWGSSMDNLTKRPLKEKQELLRIYEKYFEKLINEEDVHKDRTRIRFIGHWEEQFPESLKKILYRCLEETKDYDQYFLNFFLAYGGTDDMLQAVRSVTKEGLTPDKITREVLKRHLMTAELSPVDLLIRTGGDPHNSDGFMMWETAYSQLAFPDMYYPDFGPEAFREVIAKYIERERRFGK
ncbi:MAG: polyprenyl diphosphate synthase [Candidatus Moraniibacteriota bacterium]